mgnify:CR=1 FL=1
MIKDILAAAGIEYKQGHFPSPPAETYAVYSDDVETDGADMVEDYTPASWPRIYHHDVTVEVYEPKPDDAAEAAIEEELDARGLPWSKEDRYWLQDVRRYQVIYEFSYTNKSK